MVTRRKFLATQGLVLAGLSGASASVFSTVSPAAAAPRKRPSGVEWTTGRLLPSFATPGHLQAATVAELSGEDQLLLTTLQGVVNRRKPELYFNYDAEDGDPDQLWLKGFDDDRVTMHADPLQLIGRYAERAKGAIVYDPEVRDSINVATTLAGLRGAVVATADQVDAYGFSVL